METSDEIKKLVKEKYGQLAEQGSGSCCDNLPCCGPIEISVMADDYSQLSGYNPDADLSLGCGLPTEHARIKKGDTVVDLGSGAGNDCFVARSLTGENGKVIGVDMTSEMIEKAKKNATTLGYANLEFVLGEIENIPLPDNTADVVISNCVMNLVPDKLKAFGETFRILKPGGHFCISDIVTQADLPEGLKNDAAMYAGCVAGAMVKDDYIKTIEKAGFKNVKVVKGKPIFLPKEILQKHFNDGGPKEHCAESVILSVTVFGEK
jgi:arsenite methyltransferase